MGNALLDAIAIEKLIKAICSAPDVDLARIANAIQEERMRRSMKTPPPKWHPSDDDMGMGY